MLLTQLYWAVNTTQSQQEARWRSLREVKFLNIDDSSIRKIKKLTKRMCVYLERKQEPSDFSTGLWKKLKVSKALWKSMRFGKLYALCICGNSPTYSTLATSHNDRGEFDVFCFDLLGQSNPQTEGKYAAWEPATRKTRRQFLNPCKEISKALCAWL